MRLNLIYFLVNNDYQYIEAERVARDLRTEGYSVSLIAVPHTLTIDLNKALFSQIEWIDSPANSKWIYAWLRYLLASQLVRSSFAPTAFDKLIIFTEFELMNQIIAQWFKCCGAEIFLLEDGGAGTYIPLTLPRADPLTWKDRVKLAMIKLIPTLQRTHFTKFSGTLIPLLDDNVLNGIILYRNLRINRKPPVYVVRRPLQNRLEICRGKAIFLNQPLYKDNIQTQENYAVGLKKILTALSDGFDEVLFKFHPRESEARRNEIHKTILCNFPNVSLVGEREPLEHLLAKIRPEAVVSYHSTPLLNLKGTGINPIFVFHLLNDLKDQSAFVAMRALLVSWQYQFPSNWQDVSSGFDPGATFDDVRGARPLSEIIGLP